MQQQTLRIIRPSSREQRDLLTTRITFLEERGFVVRYSDLPSDPEWTYTAAKAADRARALVEALSEPDTQAVLCARGGYGASDLLAHLPWDQLATLEAKLLVGFSDVSALHCALFARLGWPGLHAPMPATVLWDTNEDSPDITALFTNLEQWSQGATSGSLPLTQVGAQVPPPLEGYLFGGCFTVLTNLLGTPFFPKSLAGGIVFIEDTDEHPARLMRAFNQWLQSGALHGAQALVVGHLRNLGSQIPDCADFVLRQFAARSPIPVFHTPLFGHTRPNYPLMIGAAARINDGRLTWQARRVGHALATDQGASR